MRCPFCGFPDTVVKDSRPLDDGASIRRRRSCMHCNSRFTTAERVQLRDLVVVKRNDAREPFERDKLARSIYTALRKRPVASAVIEKMIAEIIRDLESNHESEVTTKGIGERVMAELIQLDPVAYIRFASVYKDFSAASDFEALIKQLNLAKNKPAA